MRKKKKCVIPLSMFLSSQFTHLNCLSWLLSSVGNAPQFQIITGVESYLFWILSHFLSHQFHALKHSHFCTILYKMKPTPTLVHYFFFFTLHVGFFFYCGPADREKGMYLLLEHNLGYLFRIFFIFLSFLTWWSPNTTQYYSLDFKISWRYL